MSTNPIEELRSQVEALQAEIKELSELEEITPEQDARLDEAIPEFETNSARLVELEARAAKVEEIRQQVIAGKITSTPGATQFHPEIDPYEYDVRSMRPGELRSAALKRIEQSAELNLSDEQRQHVELMVRRDDGNVNGSRIAERLLITEHPTYRSAFVKLWHANGSDAGLTPEEQRAVAEFRTMVIGTDSAGGYGVPVLIDPTIILTSQGSTNEILAVSTVKTITNDQWVGVSSDGMTWSWDGEAVEVSDDSPTLAQPSIPTSKAQGFIPYSIEVGMDYPNFAASMSALLLSGYNELLAHALILGNGTTQPTGIATALNATASEVVPTTDGAFGAVDAYALWNALPERYRQQATWLSSTSTMSALRRFASATVSDANFTINLTEEAIPRLFGHRYITSEYMASFTGTTGQSDYLIVGDFSYYYVIQRAGMNVENIPHLFSTGNNRPMGVRGWYAWARVGADSVNDKAFRMLSNT